MQKSQVFFVEFRKYCVEVPNNQCCGDLRAIELAYECPETGFFCGNFVAVEKFRKNPVSLVRVRKFLQKFTSNLTAKSTAQQYFQPSAPKTFRILQKITLFVLISKCRNKVAIALNL